MGGGARGWLGGGGEGAEGWIEDHVSDVLEVTGRDVNALFPNFNVRSSGGL